MTDLLVKLYTLPSLEPEISYQRSQGITVRRAFAPEKHLVLAWVQGNFNSYWVSECDVAFHNLPVICWTAIEDGQIIGFACYECTYKNFFGPMGVLEIAQGGGVGQTLLLASLHDMWVQGYAYAIVGGVGPVEFYRQVVEIMEITDSTPGIFGDMLRK